MMVTMELKLKRMVICVKFSPEDARIPFVELIQWLIKTWSLYNGKDYNHNLVQNANGQMSLHIN